MAKDPTELELRLAESLHDMSNCLSDMGEGEDAAKLYEETLKMMRRLAESNPAAFILSLHSCFATMLFNTKEINGLRLLNVLKNPWPFGSLLDGRSCISLY